MDFVLVVVSTRALIFEEILKVASFFKQEKSFGEKSQPS